jgi:NAD(P)-dependent dehydrogenase (short-subunit alcohol dehydrogenase family)
MSADEASDYNDESKNRTLGRFANRTFTTTKEDTPMALVVITGTSSGIGLATAVAFGRAGHNVHATMRNTVRAPELAQIAARERLPVTISTVDVDSDLSVKEGIARIMGEAGPIEVLVNNAGIERTGSVEDLPLTEFRAVMETNYFGALRCIQAVLPTMRARRSGCIINVTSVAGRIANTPFAAYTASKFALEALSESLAQEMKPFNVRIAIVEPSIVDTPMLRRLAMPHAPSLYPQQRRLAALYAATLKSPTSPSVVGEKVLEIFEGETWQLRHPVGPGVEAFLATRNRMSDEEWIDWGALDDASWYERVKADFGMDLRPEA